MQKANHLLCSMGVIVALPLLGLSPTAVAQPTSSTIEVAITGTPSDLPSEKLANDPITGIVTGADPKEHKVVVYARGGEKWWVQPTAAEPYVDIGKNGRWESETHGGEKFVALVVVKSYKPEATLSKLPAIGGDILAKSEMEPPGKKPEKKADKKSEP